MASARSRGLRQPVRVLELRENQRVDPLRVGGSLDALREVRPQVLDERVAHAREAAQVSVVREDDAGADELEGVQVRLRDDRLVRVRDTPNMGDQARRRQLRRQEPQVAVERRHGGHAVGERHLGSQRRRVPRLHAEAGEVEKRVHHPRAVRLPDEGVVGVEQQIRRRQRLTEVGEHPAHSPIVLGRGPCRRRRSGRHRAQMQRVGLTHAHDVRPMDDVHHPDRWRTSSSTRSPRSSRGAPRRETPRSRGTCRAPPRRARGPTPERRSTRRCSRCRRSDPRRRRSA